MCSTDGRGQLNEDALAGFRVEKADHSGDASSWRLIDELDAPLLERLEFRVYVGRLEADVVETLAFALQETADGGVGARGLEELDLTLADCEERGFHALVFDRVLGMDMEAEGVAVEVESFVDVVDGDADVVDLLNHRLSAVGRTMDKCARAPALPQIPSREDVVPRASVVVAQNDGGSYAFAFAPGGDHVRVLGVMDRAVDTDPFVEALVQAVDGAVRQ